MQHNLNELRNLVNKAVMRDARDELATDANALAVRRWGVML